MRSAILYVHGKGGSPEEAARFGQLFPSRAVMGLDYRSETPWETREEIRVAVGALARECDRVSLIANSIGAYYAMNAGIDDKLDRAYLISPILDMERLILDMMRRAGVDEETLREKGTVPTDFGEVLSWEYLTYVREHPIEWNVRTDILIGGADAMLPREVAEQFAATHSATLTVMENGEHWFHTQEQLRFLDRWLARCKKATVRSKTSSSRSEIKNENKNDSENKGEIQ